MRAPHSLLRVAFVVGGRHEAAVRRPPPFWMCAEWESEREAEARFAVLTFLIKRSVECPVH